MKQPQTLIAEAQN